MGDLRCTACGAALRSRNAAALPDGGAGDAASAFGDHYPQHTDLCCNSECFTAGWEARAAVAAPVTVPPEYAAWAEKVRVHVRLQQQVDVQTPPDVYRGYLDAYDDEKDAYRALRATALREEP